MESCSLKPSTVTITPTFLTKSVLFEKSCAYGQLPRFPNFNKQAQDRKLKIIDAKTRASGMKIIRSLAVEASPGVVDLKDENLAFVAGATGRVGSRTVRELLKLGFQVRAGVRSAQNAETLVQSVKQMKLDVEGVQLIEKLEIVECDLEKRDQIGQALGNASMVLCCIGASEKEVFDITGPYRIDYQATKNLIDAATVAKVKHFIMVSSLGTNKLGFPAAILNLFWGVLIWKRKAEEALIASGLPYTIVRPGGMERPTDAYKETHNITLSEEDTLFGGQVSNLQVAELMAFMAKNRELSYCKVVEVIAETTAPLTPMDKLLTKIPSQRIEPKRSYVADSSGPAPSKTVMSEASSLSAEKKPAQVMPAMTKPLSPYTAYDDLKPPTSPIPTAPSGQKATANPSAAMSPNIPGTQMSSSETGPVEAKIARPLSPYVAYDDLKPPTSPSPAAPLGSLQSSSSILNGEKTGNSAPPTSAAWKNPHQLKPNLRPLSPYTMYEDLKPPASPAPSLKKLN